MDNTTPPATTPNPTFREPRYVWGPVFKRQTTAIFDGAPYAGKTILAMQYMKEVLSTPEGGTSKLFDLTVAGGLKMAYVSTDKVTSETYETAADVGLDLGLLTAVITPGHPLITGLDHKAMKDQHQRFGQLLHLMDELMMAYPDLDVLVIEAFTSWFGIDLNSLAKVSAKMEELVQWNERFPNLAVVGICHAGKARSDYTMHRAIDRINASAGGLLGFSGGTMILEDKDELESTAWRLTIRPRHAGEITKWLGKAPDSPCFVLVSDLVTAPKEKKGDLAERLILSLTEDTPRHYKELIDAVTRQLGCAKSTVKPAVKRLLDDGKLERIEPEGTYRAVRTLAPPVDESPAA